MSPRLRGSALIAGTEVPAYVPTEVPARVPAYRAINVDSVPRGPELQFGAPCDQRARLRVSASPRLRVDLPELKFRPTYLLKFRLRTTSVALLVLQRQMLADIQRETVVRRLRPEPIREPRERRPLCAHRRLQLFDRVDRLA